MCGAMMNQMGMPGGMLWVTVLPLMLLVLLAGAGAAVALVAARAVDRSAVPASGSPYGLGDSRAVAVAKERYARGEIDRAEFERILDTVLRGEDHDWRRSR